MATKRPTRPAEGPPPVVAYVRVSSEEQAQADRFSLPQQRKAIEGYCKGRGWEIVAWYADEGVSAKTDNIRKRPDFHRMITDLLDGRVRAEVVVTHSLDRFARNLMLAMNTLRDLSKHDILYSSVTESDFDYANPDKRMHLQILCMFAEYFSEKLSQHTAKGKKGRAESGLPNGRLSYGYRNPDAGTDRSGPGIFNSSVAVVDEREAGFVRLAFEMYATGTKSFHSVALALNAAGARTRNTFKDGSRPFSKDTVDAMLQNIFYAGQVCYSGGGATNRAADADRVRGRHDPIIEQELFDRVQEARRMRGQQKTQPQKHTRSYALAGLLECAHCGGPLRAQSQSRGGGYYRCTATDRAVACASGTARKPSIRCEEAEEQVGQIVAGLELAPDWKERAMAAAGADVDREAMLKERGRLDRRLETIRKHARDEIMTREEYFAEKAQLEDQIARLRIPAEVDLDLAATFLTDLRTLWESDAVTAEQRSDLCHRLFVRITCDTVAGRIREMHLPRELAPLFAVLPGQMHTSGGSDGIRTRGLLRDRQAC